VQLGREVWSKAVSCRSRAARRGNLGVRAWCGGLTCGCGPDFHGGARGGTGDHQPGATVGNAAGGALQVLAGRWSRRQRVVWGVGGGGGGGVDRWERDGWGSHGRGSGARGARAGGGASLRRGAGVGGGGCERRGDGGGWARPGPG